MKKGIFYLVVMCMCLSVGVMHVQAQTPDTLLKEVTSIPKPTWIFNSGMSKGMYHDRQDLGFILKENTVLSVRQVNPNFKENLTVRLLGNDSKTEKSVSVGLNWTQISSTEPLIPFVDTPYGSASPKLEYKIESSIPQKPLPIYQYKTSEDDFFNAWDQFDGDYALVKGNDFQLLIPKRDKEMVRNLNNFASLDELIDYYNDIFAYYNQMAGFDDSSVENQNGQNRYFLKADLNGPGGAYYGPNWTANSYATIDMWLTKNHWGTLHEIAHGYQTGFDGMGMYTGEVSNNLFGAQYQYEKYGKEADQTGWLFEYGNKENVENDLYKKMIVNQGTYDSANLREKLILLTMLKQKAGNDAFTKMYQGYRKLANQPDFDKADYLLPDLLNKYYSETSRQDFTPALKKWGLTIDESQSAKNRFAGYPAVASLADLVPESQLSRARELLDDSILINSNFEMVQNQDIASLNLSGNLTLQLKSNDIQDLKGIKITLKDGTKEVASQIIDGEQISFKDIPNGIYSLKFSGGKMSDYVPDNFYVYVKENENETTIALNEIKISNLANQTIQFLGLGDKLFGTFSTNLNNQEALFSINDTSPHSYFSGKLYSQLVVYKDTGLVTYEKSVEGTNAVVSNDQLSLSEGDYIKIYHAESDDRLLSSDNIIDINQRSNHWIMTKWGLQNQTLQNDPQQDLIKKIDSKGTSLLEEEEKTPIPYEESTDKKQLLSAIKLLDEPYKTQFMNKFSSLFK
ncbi:putative mucin/carbohydrate-binding domain-containing protein [Carnobacterium gallinarum]|uniref:putative mucin/carbohydrate-binding domain-containing protein n=1 Tax=Carnobacterium gallinarum TaxID=2749 RepID=UPI000551C729|nr:putative mucin/carbohydrate-binding domain-containing protein [Carnobacterium gallinarum]